MKVTVKPRIKLCGGYVWSCTGAGIVRRGNGPQQAYDRWEKAWTQEESQRVRASNRWALAPQPLRRADSPQAIPAVRRPTVAPLNYPESMVVTLRGTAPRKTYTSPLALRINQARASAVQPPLRSISATEERKAS